MKSLPDLRAVQKPDTLPLGMWSGIVAAGAATTEELIWVVIPAITDEYRVGPCRWMPRVEPTTIDGEEAARVVLPARGDVCLVAIDETNTPWVTVYGAA